MPSIKISILDVRKGDSFVSDGVEHWTATADARRDIDGDDAIVLVPIVWRDGAHGERAWNDDAVITVERPDGSV